MTPLELLIVRHGIAEVRETFAATGKPDESRPLTDEGRRRMRQCAKGLKQLLPNLGAVASSPLTRALETGEILAARYQLQPITLDALAPGGSRQALMAFLESERGTGTVALVGHEPDLGVLAAWMLAGSGGFMPLRKGGACLLRFDHAITAGAGTLLWAAPPKLLRNLR